MRVLMVSGDRQVVLGEKGPFWSMQREFSRHFERVDVLCPRPRRPPTVTTIHERVHFHPADCPRARMPGWIVSTGERLIAEHGHRLIVSHDYGWFYNGVGSARLSRRTGVPYVSEIHHVPGHPVSAGLRERFDKAVARAYVRWARERAVAFRVVNAGETAPLLERWGVPRSRIVVLPSLYIDLEVFRPDPADPGFDQDVVFAGRMVGNKGLDRLVDALALLDARGRRTTALLVGRGPRLQATRERAARRGLEGAVRFVEWLETPADLARAYRRSRLCVCASSCEGGPRFTVEALACGTPVVSTSVGVMGELLASGACGRLAGCDARGLSEAIGAVLDDEPGRARMAEAAPEAARPFEYARAIRGYAEGLKRLAGEAAA